MDAELKRIAEAIEKTNVILEQIRDKFGIVPAAGEAPAVDTKSAKEAEKPSKPAKPAKKKEPVPEPEKPSLVYEREDLAAAVSSIVSNHPEHYAAIVKILDPAKKVSQIPPDRFGEVGDALSTLIDRDIRELAAEARKEEVE